MSMLCLGIFLLLSLIVVIDDFHVIFFNLSFEIIPVDIKTQNIIAVSPYFDLFSLIIFPLSLLFIIAIGFLYDYVGYWKLLLLIAIILMLSTYLAESLALMIISMPLIRAVFILTLAKIITLNKNLKSRVTFLSLCCGIYTFAYTKTWEFFLSKSLLHFLSSQNFIRFFDTLILYILICSILAFIIAMKKFPLKFFFIKNLPLKFFISCLRMEKISFYKSDLIMIALFFIIIDVARYAFTHVVMKNTFNFDINLWLILFMEMLYLSVLHFWFKTKVGNHLRTKLIKMYLLVGCFLFATTLVTYLLDMQKMIVQIMYYLISPALIIIFTPFIAYIVLNAVNEKTQKHVGFCIAISFALIVIIWRLCFFIAHYLAQAISLFS
ncbi:hypothetical protein [Cysteiniphilum sp. JM-1]|uniref:hypothetical protein n=1 Tax=Cysteiniphilum sp. JM-1 TaxID=2610891 RepID=UPI001CD18C4C|nr:hypothetical protein [Cysteiniphilum sp. JM-1]